MVSCTKLDCRLLRRERLLKSNFAGVALWCAVVLAVVAPAAQTSLASSKGLLFPSKPLSAPPSPLDCSSDAGGKGKKKQRGAVPSLDDILLRTLRASEDGRAYRRLDPAATLRLVQQRSDSPAAQREFEREAESWAGLLLRSLLYHLAGLPLSALTPVLTSVASANASMFAANASAAFHSSASASSSSSLLSGTGAQQSLWDWGWQHAANATINASAWLWPEGATNLSASEPWNWTWSWNLTAAQKEGVEAATALKPAPHQQQQQQQEQQREQQQGPSASTNRLKLGDIFHANGIPESFVGCFSANGSALRLPVALAAEECDTSTHRKVLLSGSDRNSHGYLPAVVAHHLGYAQRWGYIYWWNKGNLANPWQPYWSKVKMLSTAMELFPGASQFVWVDDDIVMTNQTKDIFVHAFGRSPSASLMVTRDAARDVHLNTGIVLVRNTFQAEQLLKGLWARATQPRNDGVDLSKDNQHSCLHEQQALEEMYKSGSADGLVVLRQRYSRGVFNLNTFLRWSHYDVEQGTERRFEHDRYTSKWRVGDFTGHCTGLSRVQRGLCIRFLLAASIAAN